MGDLDEFRDRYLQDPMEVERYKQLRRLYYPLQVLTYLASIPFMLVLLAIGGYLAFDQPNMLLGTGRELMLYGLIETGLVGLFIVTYALRQEIRSYDEEGFNIIYHELATCIRQYQDDNLESVLVHLDRLKSLIDRYGSAISFRNDEIRQYISALQELESDEERQELLKETFPDVIEVLVEEAMVRDKSIQPYIERIRTGRTRPEPTEIVLESIVTGARSLFTVRRNRLYLLAIADTAIIVMAAMTLNERGAITVTAGVGLVTAILERAVIRRKYRSARALLKDVLDEDRS